MGSGASIVVTYKGGASGGNPTSPAEILKGKKYIFQSSSNGMQAGDSVYATSLHLKINNGDNVAGPTVGQLTINHKKLFLNGTIIFNGSGVPIDTTFTYTTVAPAFLIQSQTSCGPLCSTNLVVNGDFEGNPPLDPAPPTCADYGNYFTSAYACTLHTSPGKFGITNDASSLNPLYTSPNSNGYFMVVDGSIQSTNTVVWQQQNINVVAGATYCFSVRARNIWQPSDAPYSGAVLPEIALNVDNMQLATSGSLLWSMGWVTNSVNYTATANGTVNLSIVLTTKGFGNDFAIDDISFASLAPQSLTVTANPPFICNAPGQTNLTVAGAPAGTDYTWTGAGVVQANSNTTTAAPTTTTTYTVVGKLGGVCVGSGSVTVQVGPPITLTATKIKLCSAGDNSALCASVPVTPLAPGDIAILRYDKPPRLFSNSSITFVPLVNLPAGTTINFTSSGWNNNSSSFTSTGSTLIYIAPAAGAAAGVLQTITSGFIPFLFNNSGDQILAYQGSSANPSFIYGLNTTNSWLTTGAPNTNQSYLPPALTDGLTAVTLNLFTANVYYNIAANTGNANAILTQISNSANWTAGATLLPYTFSMTGVATAGFAWSGGVFTANGPCTPAIPGTITSSITVNQAGVYTVTYTDIHGCVGKASQTILKSSLNVSASPNPVCPGALVLLSVSGGGPNYVWTGNNLSPSLPNGSSIYANPTINSTYTVKETSSAGCSGSIIVTVIPITATASPSSFCGTPGQVTLTAAGGPPGITYDWHLATPTIAGVATVTPSATTTYTVTTNVTGCIGHVVVGVSPLPVVTITGTTTLCQGDQSTLCATAPAPTLFPGDIAIIQNNNTAGTISFITLVDLPAGTQINFTNRGWNKTTSSFTAAGGTYNYTNSTANTIPAGTVVTFNPGFTLLNPGDQILAYQLIGGIPSFIYGLSTTGWITSGTPTPVTSYMPLALTDGYTAVRLNAASPDVFYNISVTGNANAILSSIGLSANWAKGLTPAAAITLSGGAAVSGFSWTGDQPSTDNGPCPAGTNSSSIKVNATGTYTVDYTDIHGCVGEKNITITVIPNVIAANTTVPVVGDNVTLSLTSTAPAGSTYKWFDQTNTPIAITADYNFVAAAAGSYYLVVTSGAVSCTTNVIKITPLTDKCSVPVIPDQTFTGGDLGTASGTIKVIDGGGGTVVFTGNYTLHGPLQLKNGTFFMTSGTVFNIDQTGDVFPSKVYAVGLYPGIYIHALDGTLRMQGATLQGANGTYSFAGIVVENSWVHTNLCNGVRNTISNGHYGMVMTPTNADIFSFNTFPSYPGPDNFNTCHYFIEDTDFKDLRVDGIYDVNKGSLKTDEVIKNCKFTNTQMLPTTGVYLANIELCSGLNCFNPVPITEGVEIIDNTFVNMWNGITVGISNFEGVKGVVADHNTMDNVIWGIYLENAPQAAIKNNNITVSTYDPTYGIGIQCIHGDMVIENNTLTGQQHLGQFGIEIDPYVDVVPTVRNNIISTFETGILDQHSFPGTYDYTNNTLTKNNWAIYMYGTPFTAPGNVNIRCNTIDNGGLSGTNYGILVDQGGFLNPLGSLTNPNGNAFIGFNGTTNFPMEYDDAASLSGFSYSKSLSAQEDIEVTNFFVPQLGLAYFGTGLANCFGPPGVVSGYRIAQSGTLSAQDSVNAAMDSLRFQLGTFRQMKTWQGEILKYFERTNNLDGLYSYCDSLEGCNLEAYNTFMLYLMNKYDIMNECSKAHTCASEVLNANPNDAEIQARTTFFNYECRQRHGGQRTLLSPFMPMNPQDSTDLWNVGNSGTSLSRTGLMRLRRHDPKLSFNTQNTYTPNYPDCGPDCKKKKNEFLKNGWEKQTGFKADKQGGQLSQNIPNPAENETIIPFLIPGDSFTSAYITIQSVVNGSEVRRIDLAQTSYGSVTVNLENLPNGVYTYTLIVDGTKQDVKRMVVVK